ITLTNSTGTTITGTGLKAANNGVAVTSNSILLNPGTYTFMMSSTSSQADFASSTQTVSLSSSFSYIGSLGVQPVNHKVGGVRIKRIAYYDAIDN
ncbi:hypothetical protein ACLUYJ_20405, partial [Acinetobacter baumannii]|uniref:hypothetical protein n=1 Tax=Acinetobacter baumannii TaxID=470 RepID=UPI003993BB3A